MYVCLFCWFLLAAWQPRSLVLPQPSVPASRANKTMNFLNCFFVKRVAYFAQNIHFNGCNFLNNSPVYFASTLVSTYKFSLVRTMYMYTFSWPRVHLSFVRTTCTYKGMLVRTNSYLVRTIVHVYCFPWPRVQLSFVHTTCTYKRNVGRTNSYLVRTIAHVYCFPWPRVQLSFVRSTCTYKGMLVRTNS